LFRIARLVYEPENNIYVQRAIRIYVYREQQKFMAFGATGNARLGLIRTPGASAWPRRLANRAYRHVQGEPGSVFLYRPEPREVAERLGVDMTPFRAGRSFHHLQRQLP